MDLLFVLLKALKTNTFDKFNSNMLLQEIVSRNSDGVLVKIFFVKLMFWLFEIKHTENML